MRANVADRPQKPLCESVFHIGTGLDFVRREREHGPDVDTNRMGGGKCSTNRKTPPNRWST